MSKLGTLLRNSNHENIRSKLTPPLIPTVSTVHRQNEALVWFETR